MSVPTQSAVLAKRRAGNWLSGFGKPFNTGLVRWLFSWFAQFTAGADLAIVEFAALSSAEVVIIAEAATLYALVMRKATATATFTKLTDNATTSSDASSDIRISMIGIKETALVYPQGLALANGATMQGNTTAGGGTGSGADGASGFAIIGAA